MASTAAARTRPGSPGAVSSPAVAPTAHDGPSQSVTWSPRWFVRPQRVVPPGARSRSDQAASRAGRAGDGTGEGRGRRPACVAARTRHQPSPVGVPVGSLPGVSCVDGGL